MPPGGVARSSARRSSGRTHGRSAFTTSVATAGSSRIAAPTAGPWPWPGSSTTVARCFSASAFARGSSVTTTVAAAFTHAASTSPSIANASAARSSSPAATRCFASAPLNGTTILGTSREYPGVNAARDPDNAAIARRLDAFAALLELAGANPYSSRAYRRAAELIRTTPAPVAELVRNDQVRRLRGIGAGIEGKLRELVETGDIAELAELERDISPELVGVGRLLGLSAQRSGEIGRALGIRTADELREAARAGRLREVPGIGPERERRILASLDRLDRPRAPRPLLLGPALALSEAIADALGGEVAGEARRGKDTIEELAVVRPTARPGPVLDAFAELPEIVAVLERGKRHAVGVTVEGVPVELSVPQPASSGTALLRATGSAGYVEALEPLPTSPDEPAVYAAL